MAYTTGVKQQDPKPRMNIILPSIFFYSPRDDQLKGFLRGAGCCLLVLLLWAVSVAPSRAQVFPFRSYSIEQGLSESVVNDMMQDKNGYIWVATGYGLNRFDGIKFTNYYHADGLRDNKIFSLLQDHRGRIWVGTRSGINMMRPGQDTLIAIPDLEPLNHVSINAIYEDDQNNLWFATDGAGAWRWSPSHNLEQLTTADGLAGNRVRSIVQYDGAIWMATREGLSHYENGRFRTFTIKDGLPDNRLRSLHVDKLGMLWIGSRGGLVRYQKDRFKVFTEKDGLVNNKVQSITDDQNGNLWIGTEEGASHMINGRFKNYSVEQGLNNHYINTMLYDREHNIWFGTFGAGISNFMGENIINFTVDEGLPNNVITSFVNDQKGNVWIATYGGGLSRYDGKKLKTYNVSDGLIDNKVYSLTTDHNGRIWIGTRWGLSIYDHGRWTNYDEKGLPIRQVRSLLEDRDGSMWLGSYGEGLMHFKNDGSFDAWTEDEGLPDNIIMNMAQDSAGAIWLATYGGVSRYSNGTFKTYTVADGLPNNGVMDLTIDDNGDVWASTFDGIARIRDGNIQSVSTADGLPDEVCYFIERSNNGLLWIGTNKGVVRFDPTGFFSQAISAKEERTHIRLLNSDQGLVAEEMNAGAVYRDKDGMMWFGSVGGVSRYNPAADQFHLVPPKIHIEQIRASEERFTPAKNLVFGHRQNSLRFDYIGISHSAPHQVLYKYRLKPLEDRWQTTMERYARYSALPPGEYTFQVQARSSGGLWSAEQASVSFRVMAPFWRQWWFYVVVGLVIVSVIMLIINLLQVRRQVDIERMRVQIASDLHDDVGSSLTEIALQTDFLQTASINDDLRESLDQIGAQSRRIVSSLDDIVWSIDARNDSLGDLTDRMQDYANNVLTPRQVQVKYDFEELDMDRSMQIEVRENVYLIFKEAVNNIVKHSDADQVLVRLKPAGNGLEMQVVDNGKTARNGRRSGHGLRNMNMRAERINAELILEREEGFKVTVRTDKV